MSDTDVQEQNLHTKAPGTSGNATPLHGVTRVGAGIFSTAGLDASIISTHVRPRGIASQLPLLPSVFTTPYYGALTGVSDDIGDEPVNPCDDAPTGYIKAATLTAQWGRVARSTATIDIDEVMLRINGSDSTDLRLVGQMFGLTDLQPRNMPTNDILNIMTAAEMVNAGVRLERKLNYIMWNGTPAANTANGGYKEFPGLDLQVATGQKDAISGTLAPSLDSLVMDFANDKVGGTGRDIVEYLAAAEFYLHTLAMTTGVDPVSWVVVMRPELWQVVTEVYPIAYNTNRGFSLPTNNYVFVDGRENVRERDAMRTGMNIQINGRTYPVIVDDGIAEGNNVNTAGLAAGQYSSSIYFLPMTITGNFPVLYREYLDYRGAGADIRYLNGKERFWTDGGQYMWAYTDNNFCFKLQAKTEQRVVLRTPHLAAKIDNVKYEPLKHLRDSDPDSPYWVNGGVSARTAPTTQAVWKP